MTEEKKIPIKITAFQLADVRASAATYGPLQERLNDLENTHGFEIVPNNEINRMIYDQSVLFMYPVTLKLDVSKIDIAPDPKDTVEKSGVEFNISRDLFLPPDLSATKLM